MKSIRPILIGIAIAIVAFVVYRRISSGRHKAPEPNSDLLLEVRPIPVTHNLALGSFAISAKSSHDVKISLDEAELRNARLSGRFSVSGGTGIQVMLLDQKQYDRFKSGSPPAEYLYLSKTAASGEIQGVFSRTGTYYLVFDNSSSSADVNVDSDVTVRYEAVHVDSGRH